MKAMLGHKVFVIGGIIVVVLAVILIRMVAFAGSGAPNLNVLVAGESKAAISELKKLDECIVTDMYDGQHDVYFSNDQETFEKYWKCNGYVEIAELIKDHPNFCLINYDSNLDLSQVEKGADYSYLEYTGFERRSDLSSEEAAEIVSRIAPFDQAIIAKSGNQIGGAIKGNGCLSKVNIFRLEDTDIWKIQLFTYSLAKHPEYATEFNDGYSKIDMSNYIDSYKK